MIGGMTITEAARTARTWCARCLPDDRGDRYLAVTVLVSLFLHGVVGVVFLVSGWLRNPVVASRGEALFADIALARSEETGPRGNPLRPVGPDVAETEKPRPVAPPPARAQASSPASLPVPPTPSVAEAPKPTPRAPEPREVVRAAPMSQPSSPRRRRRKPRWRLNLSRRRPQPAVTRAWRRYPGRPRLRPACSASRAGQVGSRGARAE